MDSKLKKNYSLEQQRQVMEDEGDIFYQNELNFFGEQEEESFGLGRPEYPPFILPNSISMEAEKKIEAEQEERVPGGIRAYNPMDMVRNLPEHRQSEYLSMMNHHKRFNGISHFFGMESNQMQSGQFLENIASDALEGSPTNRNFELDKLFTGEGEHSHQRQALEQTLLNLNKHFTETNQRTMGNMHLSRTILPSFYDHFENFALVFDSSKYLHDFAENLKNKIGECKKLKGPGIDLMASLYDFWMKSFKELINEIWRYSQKYTLNFFKKNEPAINDLCDSQSEGHNSASSNTMGSKDKRKGWTIDETVILQQLIDSNVIFSQSALRKLAEQFGRSVSSISSKIQKLTRNTRRAEVNMPEESLLQKTLQILKMHPEGLNRETIIEKLNENYEMGYGGQWQKSVGQLLSSRKEFIKIKCKHRLLNPQQHQMLNLNHIDKSKLTFKDRVTQVFLQFSDGQADLKSLVDTYIQLFEDTENGLEPINDDRKKSIEANISKTLSRYEIFDGKARTIYKLHPFNNEQTQPRRMESELENYFDL